MTVCTAAMFAWAYDEKDFGQAIVVASDRMFTDQGLGIEYESSIYKGLILDKTHMIFVAGSVVVHSALVMKLNAVMAGVQGIKTSDIAETYARMLREYRTEEASRRYLAPFGLDAKSFVAQQKLMDGNLVSESLSGKKLNRVSRL